MAQLFPVLMIRGNQLPQSQTILSKNEYNGVSAIVIEDNIANWIGLSITYFWFRAILNIDSRTL
jgi:hypothetical protein